MSAKEVKNQSETDDKNKSSDVAVAPDSSQKADKIDEAKASGSAAGGADTKVGASDSVKADAKGGASPSNAQNGAEGGEAGAKKSSAAPVMPAAPVSPAATVTPAAQAAPVVPAGASAGGAGKPAAPSSSGQISAAKVDALMRSLFVEGVTCVTAPNGSFPIKEDQRSLLALFSNGRFLVSEAHKFDGRVLSFEVLARKRRLQVGKPEYIPQELINAIYEKALNTSYSVGSADSDDQLQMQKDFVTIIARAAAIKVSDVHVVVADKTTVMFRLNGLMQTEIEYSKDWGESFVRAAFSSADISDANYAQSEYQAAQKLGTTPLRGSKGKLLLPKNVLGIRLQFNPIAFGSRYLVMRLLYSDEGSEANSLAALGYSERDEEIFFRLRSVPTGMIIISGPTGSGKSTTLQRNMIRLLEERNYESNLLTVEDPPEYPIPGARQMPVTNAPTDAEKDIEFTKALAATLRSDPDVLMIGEIRTLAAAQLAFKGALSGHAVWTTLHANSAPAVLMRLRDMGMEPFKLQDPGIIKGMVAQRLFRKLCPYCRIPAIEQPNHPAVKRLYKAFDEFGLSQAFLRGPGCSFCNHKGVKGRTAVGEMVIPDAKLLELLINNETKKATDYWMTELGGRTLKENALEKMLIGDIDIEEIERWCGLLDEKAVY